MDRLVMLVPTLLQGAFLFALGACVGSFVNVVAWRWPRRQGIVSPPSRCSTCGRGLRWWENVPLISWIALRGRCRTCGVRLGPGHLLVELGSASLFAGSFALLFAGPWQEPPGSDAWWWLRLGPWHAMPAFIAVLVLWGCLLAIALIDAETGFVPLPVTGLAIVVGLVAMTVQATAFRGGSGALAAGWPCGSPSPAWCAAGVGGLLGVIAAAVALQLGLVSRTFEAAGQDQDWPPARSRREVLKEVPFLLMPLIGMLLGHRFVTTGALAAEGPVWLALGASGLGLLVGAGSIWITRILGTLAFGREAMGLGDVHLMAAAGVVLGWRDSALVFLAAPFLALAWVAVSGGLAKWRGQPARELPYGPHLAMACVLVYLGRPWVVPAARVLFGIA
jgi:leader peptidase (prepilin peptidase)/N-methyltransferase